jgi:hypothetical protein
VNGDGAVWPSVEQEVSCLFPTPSSYKACRVGGLHRPFLLVPSLWASKEKELGRRQAHESPPQASNPATTCKKRAAPTGATTTMRYAAAPTATKRSPCSD